MAIALLMLILWIGIEVVGDLAKKNSNTRSDHFVIVYVDDKDIVKSEKKPGAPAPRWNGKRTIDCEFAFYDCMCSG